MKKIAFIIGHHENSKGYHSEYFDLKEWDFYKQLECKLEPFGGVFYHDKTINGYLSRCKDTASRIGNEHDLVIALHFNSFNESANGCECFYWGGNDEGLQLAKTLVDNYCELTGAKPRGAKPYTKKADGGLPRGAGEVYYPKQTALLFEPFFGDSKEDCQRWCEGKFIKAIKCLV